MRVACLVTKAPDPARSKTRLTTLPPEARVALAGAMIEDVVETLTRLPGVEVVVACDPGPEHPFFVELARRRPVTLIPQPAGPLGERLRALSEALQADGSPLCFVGGDCPHLPPETVNAAFDALTRADLALAEADDGGYVLIALRAPAPAVFEGIPWSTEGVAEATRRQAEVAGLTVAALPPSWDVDRPSDLIRLKDLPPGSPAARSRALLTNALLYTGGSRGLG